MSKTLSIQVNHVTRVEGHGNILINLKDGKIEKIEWQVPEAPRFFEAMVRGKSWQDIQTIVSRICGICSVSHSLVAIKAIEDAMGISVSKQTDYLRILTHYTEYIESHVLHVGYLVAPDLLGQKSVVPLVASHPDLVKTIIALHRLGNEGMELLAGRMTHPVTLKPGGFARLPTETELRAFQAKLKAAVPQLVQVAEAVLALAGKLPDFRRATEYVALVEPGTYTFYHGSIGSSDAPAPVPVRQFESVVNEYVSPQSTAKWCKWHRDAYAVGALARFNLNASFLRPLAKKTAASFGLKPGVCNPFLNTVVQVVETVQVVEHALELIDDLLSTGIKPEPVMVNPKAGEGAAAVEAPRGILFHRYAFDDKGNCLKANLCIPTNQNHANIQKDFEAFVPQILDRPPEEIRLLLEMLVRSYDPCISCSTHCLNVEFV
ncbi:MAG: Ni/Fe hydrogenase subunit alpha [Verrucomicrobia bacterium]|nr:Ni/Fe hydrogenase subunit alpha [Verrucomicrobiota bacterium]MBU1735952.1 Ni/Fe hydrogenase subunit alpha [Verrucomicrobiota bacterium]MBU1855616.1 Ni/Fe hydrogenase subunit alpha [Verrucomicrobiota bacterium]